jgi:plastocyanin
VRLLLVALLLAACATSAAPASPPIDVRITNANDFSLHAITVPVGGSVKWTNDSAVSHTVTFTDSFRIPADNGTFSKKVDVAGSVSRAFPAAGTYSFFCMIHPGMQGTVTVGAP